MLENGFVHDVVRVAACAAYFLICFMQHVYGSAHLKTGCVTRMVRVVLTVAILDFTTSLPRRKFFQIALEERAVACAIVID